MEYIEANPLPPECENCNEDCGSCDIAGKRWYLSKADELRLQRKSLLKAIERYERQIARIDAEIEVIEYGGS